MQFIEIAIVNARSKYTITRQQEHKSLFSKNSSNQRRNRLESKSLIKRVLEIKKKKKEKKYDVARC